MAQLKRRTKRERFLPYSFQRHSISLTVGSRRIDDKLVDEGIDPDRRLVRFEDDIWHDGSITLQITVNKQLLAAVVSADELPVAPVDLVVVFRCAETKIRRCIVVCRAPLNQETFSATMQFQRQDVFGSAELCAYLVRTTDAQQRLAGYAWLAGCRVASSRPWELRFDIRRKPTGRFLDVRYRSFRQDEVLSTYQSNLYRLELDQELPVLWVNADHDKVTPILSDKGSTGKRARLREVFYDVIAHGVWTQLFVRAADDLVGPDDLTYDWEDSVLRELLPGLLPGYRTHGARLSALRRTLDREGLPATIERLDAALQQKNEITRHMTRLVEETVESKAS